MYVCIPAVGSQNMVWSAPVVTPPATCGVERETSGSLVLVNPSFQPSCPENITVTVPTSKSLAKVTWRMPTIDGYSNITSHYPVGTYTSLIPLPGSDTVCIFVISVSGESVHFCSFMVVWGLGFLGLVFSVDRFWGLRCGAFWVFWGWGSLYKHKGIMLGKNFEVQMCTL